MAVNYPVSLDTDSTLYKVNNQAKTYLNGTLATAGGNNAQTNSIDLVDGTVFPTTAGILMIGTELIAYTTRTSNKISGITRGFGGTTAATHTSGSLVKMIVSAEHHNANKDAIIAIESKIGITGAEAFPVLTVNGTGPASAPKAGDIWRDTSTGQFKIYDGSAWITFA